MSTLSLVEAKPPFSGLINRVAESRERVVLTHYSKALIAVPLKEVECLDLEATEQLLELPLRPSNRAALPTRPQSIAFSLARLV